MGSLSPAGSASVTGQPYVAAQLCRHKGPLGLLPLQRTVGEGSVIVVTSLPIRD